MDDKVHAHGTLSDLQDSCQGHRHRDAISVGSEHLSI
jgi:hypothetical protein